MYYAFCFRLLVKERFRLIVSDIYFRGRTNEPTEWGGEEIVLGVHGCGTCVNDGLSKMVNGGG